MPSFVITKSWIIRTCGKTMRCLNGLVREIFHIFFVRPSYFLWLKAYLLFHLKVNTFRNTSFRNYKQFRIKWCITCYGYLNGNLYELMFYSEKAVIFMPNFYEMLKSTKVKFTHIFSNHFLKILLTRKEKITMKIEAAIPFNF